MSHNASEFLLNGVQRTGSDPGACERGVAPDMRSMRDQILRENHISSGWLAFAAERISVVLAGAECDPAVVNDALEYR